MPDDLAIAISATFTAEAIQPGLAFWAAQLGLEYEIRFAPYGQLFQQLLDGGSLFARNRGFNVALVRLEDWRAAGITESIARLADGARAAASFPAPLIVAACPPAAEFEAEFPEGAMAVAKALAGLPQVYFLAPDQVLSRYPVAEVHDARAADLGHLPYTPLYFAALATAIARQIHAIATAARKVIALDCDDTLWQGICGEDGPRGVVLDGPRQALQEFMAERRRAGYLLALCSRNNEADVTETFRAHPEMPLAIGDFAARRVNWEAKSRNLVALAEELDLALNSFILVDDNSKESTEVRAALPEVLVLPLPADAAEIPALLEHYWAFDRARITEEDRRRGELYAQRAQRARAQRAAASLEEFLESLDLRVEMAPMAEGDLPRVAQLTTRTSQMNTSCLRRSEAEIRELGGRGWECRTVRVRDRFGDYGLTGAVVFRIAGDTLEIDTFLLSCRVLGRGVEHRVIARMGEIAKERGLAALEIAFTAGPRNQPAWLFLHSLTAPDSGNRFRLEADTAAAARYHPAERAVSQVLPAPRQPAAANPPIDYFEIATALRTPEAVLARIQAAARPRVPLERRMDAPRSPLEGQLAEIWAGLLNLPAVGVHESFFDLGGHSLLAVQLLSRVGQMLGVDLSLEVVYSGEFTVAELAKAIELKDLEQSGEEYQQLIDELDRLTDEEVRALLAKEQEGGA